MTNRYRFKNVVRRLVLGKEWDYISKSTDLYKLIDRYLCVLSADRTAPIKDIFTDVKCTVDYRVVSG